MKYSLEDLNSKFRVTWRWCSDYEAYFYAPDADTHYIYDGIYFYMRAFTNPMNGVEMYEEEVYELIRLSKLSLFQ